MFCTPRAYSASSLLTAQRVGQRELAARAAVAEAAEAAEEKARWPQHLLSPAALRLLDPSLDGRGAQARYTAGVLTLTRPSP